jgi:hypothetical protein
MHRSTFNCVFAFVRVVCALVYLNYLIQRAVMIPYKHPKEEKSRKMKSNLIAMKPGSNIYCHSTTLGNVLLFGLPAGGDRTRNVDPSICALT